MKKFLIISLTSILFLCTSCITLPWGSGKDPVGELKKNLTIAQEKIAVSEKKLTKSSEKIKKSASDIKTSAKEIETSIPEDTDVNVKNKINSIGNTAESIIVETDTINDISKDLHGVTSNLDKVEDSADKALESNQELIDKIKQLEDDKKIALKKAMNYLIVIAILLISISAVGVFQGNYKAIGGIIGGVMIIVVSLAVSVLYMKLAWIGLVGIIGVLLIVGFGIYQGLSIKKEKKKDEKSLEETVLTVEALKEKLPEEAKKEFFGENAYPGKVKSIQSKETEEKVLNIRKKLKDVIEPTIPKS